jgi:hypothetical protein
MFQMHVILKSVGYNMFHQSEFCVSTKKQYVSSLGYNLFEVRWRVCQLTPFMGCGAVLVRQGRLLVASVASPTNVVGLWRGFG